MSSTPDGNDDLAPRHTVQVVARRTGLTPDVLRVWEKRYAVVRPGRSGGAHRLYSDLDVRRLVLLKHLTDTGHRIGRIAGLSVVELQHLVQDEAEFATAPGAADTGAPPAARPHLDACLAASRALDPAGLQLALEGAAIALSVPQLLEGVITPLLRTLGEDWQNGTGRVAHEHLASAAVRALLGRMRLEFTPHQGAPELLITTPAGHVHEIGALTVAVVAAMDGWRATYLGPSMPAVEIAATARARAPRALALSLVYPADDPQLDAELRVLRRALPDLPMLAGGRAADALAALLDELSITRAGSITAAREHLAALRARPAG